MPKPRDAIVHADDCDRPVANPDTGTGWTCDCAARQAFPDETEVAVLNVEVLVGADMHLRECEAATGESCDECTHSTVTERICPDCGASLDEDDRTGHVLHADDCPKVPHIRLLTVLLYANERVERIRDLLAAHDGNAPPSAYETLDRIREAIGG